jgi:hypothetical protein
MTAVERRTISGERVETVRVAARSRPEDLRVLGGDGIKELKNGYTCQRSGQHMNAVPTYTIHLLQAGNVVQRDFIMLSEILRAWHLDNPRSPSRFLDLRSLGVASQMNSRREYQHRQERVLR